MFITRDSQAFAFGTRDLSVHTGGGTVVVSKTSKSSLYALVVKCDQRSSRRRFRPSAEIQTPGVGGNDGSGVYRRVTDVCARSLGYKSVSRIRFTPLYLPWRIGWWVKRRMGWVIGVWVIESTFEAHLSSTADMRTPC
ncbi:hypothetical protein ACI65C_008591 [Semiaphis heraclei]